MKKSPIRKLQDKIWELCKQITRLRYGYNCYTCPKRNLTKNDCHTGHMWPKGALGAFMKYDLRILRPQCYNCNINLGGNGAVFHRNMINEIGQEAMNALETERQTTVQASEHYPKIYEEYKNILKLLTV